MPVRTLREKLGTHMSDNKPHYSQFLRTDEKTNENYDKMIQDIRSQRVWKVGLADCLPLAVANIFRVSVKIVCSRISSPVYNIQPDLVTQDGNVIILAYSAMPGKEHFDTVRRKSDTSVSCHAQKSVNTSPQLETETLQTPTKHPDVETIPHITPHKDADFQSPKKSDIKRKRKCTPELWKRNMRKRNRDAGLEYISQKDKHMSARNVKPVNSQSAFYVNLYRAVIRPSG